MRTASALADPSLEQALGAGQTQPESGGDVLLQRNRTDNIDTS